MLANSVSSFLKNFCFAIRVGLANLAVGELPNTDSVWIENVFLSIGEFNCLDARFFNLLDSSIGEDALLLAILEYALNSSIGESTKKIDKLEKSVIRIK